MANINAHGICKIGKVQFTSGSIHTYGWVFEDAVGGYTTEVTFDYSFITNPAIFCSAVYPGGSPAKLSFIYKTTTGFKLFCSSAINTLWVDWFALSFNE